MELLGCHVGMKAPDMLLGAAREALAYRATCFMIYTGAPQNTRRKPISAMKIAAGQKLMQTNQLGPLIIHAPYIINLGNTKKPQNFEFAVNFLHEEIQRAAALNATQITFHPGAHVGAGDQAAIKNIIRGLNAVIEPQQTVKIALETMAGKGTEVGRTFEQLAEIIAGVVYNDKLSVTFDTCHTNDAGYAVKDDFDGVLEHFDHCIGLERLQVLHLNDSKNPCGSHKDRHENIGFGTIGFQALNYIVHHPALKSVPKIMETPYIGLDKQHQYPPYAFEIQMLEQQKFFTGMKKKVIENQGQLLK
ncbi:deoxyribonuclease IV [Liquorilactobacillus sicerae]|uniref:deoxyribonuclease IV n=1 Tax=Liquorilactobacillus sicerae TaxID=1416943 RepID=UPI0024816DA1|nr:deoxyribonuclease IV [Liquorilactobacillus sicerae]